METDLSRCTVCFFPCIAGILLCVPALTPVLAFQLGFSCRELIQVARLSEQFLSEQ